MSADQPELEHQIEEIPFQPLKFNNQNTTIYFKHKNSVQSPFLDFEQHLQNLTDCSFQQSIHKENMDILQATVSRYLQDSLAQQFDKSLGFKDASLYQNLPFEVGHDELQALTLHNQLLNQRDKQSFLKMVSQEDDILGLIRQATSVFGLTVAKEFVFVVYHLLVQKLSSFKAILAPKANIIPRFQCFYGEQQLPFQNSCPIYQEINLEQIPSFAESELQELSSTLYFSCQIKYLNLREVKPDTKGNILNRFNVLMKQISKTLFFTLAGAVEPPPSTGSTLFSLEISREISFSELAQGNILSIQRAISRPFVPCEQEQLDFLSKRLKFQ